MGRGTEMKEDNVEIEITLQRAARDLADIHPWNTDFGEYDSMARYVNKELGKGPLADEIIERAIAIHRPEERGDFLKDLFIIRGQEMVSRMEQLLVSDQLSLRYAAIVGLLRIDEVRALRELKQFCKEIAERDPRCPENSKTPAAFDLSRVSEDLFSYDKARCQEIEDAIWK